MKAINKHGRIVHIMQPAQQYWYILHGCIYTDRWEETELHLTRMASGNFFIVRDAAVMTLNQQAQHIQRLTFTCVNA